MAKAKEFDFKMLKHMSEEQKQQVYYTLAKRANQRFRDIESRGEKSFAIEKSRATLNKYYNRDTFKQSKKLKGKDLDEGLQLLEKFYTAKTSTIKGIKENRKHHIELFNEKGINIKDNKKFFEFLSSQQFKTLSSYADSDQIIEDFNVAIDDGFSIKQIERQYTEYLNTEMTFEQVAEKREKIKNRMIRIKNRMSEK
jgi:hypothetical protein